MNYRRYYQPGGTYFFTLITHNRQPILTEEHHIERLRKAFRHVRAQHPFAIDAIVILPDHLHTVWRLPKGDANFSIRWKKIKHYFSIGVTAGSISPSKRNKREKGVWQRRFWEHYIRNADDWRKHIDYIHYNPVRHGYVANPDQWPYSSFSRAVTEGWYTKDWGISEPATIENMEYE